MGAAGVGPAGGKVTGDGNASGRAFEKWEGLGNDFVVVYGDPPPLPAAVCDRRRGVGADGILALTGGGDAVWRMLVLNADGSRPEMCGNGLRCVVGSLASRGSSAWADRGRLNVETDAGLRACRYQRRQDGTYDVQADMGRARVGTSFAYEGISFLPVDVGNPHVVGFVADGDARLDAVGPALQTHREGGVNVELCTLRADGGIDVVVWERGVGRTRACGTGACAVAAAAVHEGRVPSGAPVGVCLPGGRLSIEVASDGGVAMTGPARRVFVGRLG
ncbi:MAG: diaminopimelate epimerase [Myxococcota bacterium]